MIGIRELKKEDNLDRDKEEPFVLIILVIPG